METKKELKILIVGDCQVGKTCLSLKYLCKYFEYDLEAHQGDTAYTKSLGMINQSQNCIHASLDNLKLNTTAVIDKYVPTILSVYKCDININLVTYSLSLTDISGSRSNEKFSQLKKHYFSITQDIDVILMCFSLVDQISYLNVSKKWYPEIKQYYKNVPILLVGTKADIKHQIKYERNKLHSPSSFDDLTANTTLTSNDTTSLANLNKKNINTSNTLGLSFLSTMNSIEKQLLLNKNEANKCNYCTKLEDEAHKINENRKTFKIEAQNSNERANHVLIVSKVSQQHIYDPNNLILNETDKNNNVKSNFNYDFTEKKTVVDQETGNLAESSTSITSTNTAITFGFKSISKIITNLMSTNYSSNTISSSSKLDSSGAENSCCMNKKTAKNQIVQIISKNQNEDNKEAFNLISSIPSIDDDDYDEVYDDSNYLSDQSNCENRDCFCRYKEHHCDSLKVYCNNLNTENAHHFDVSRINQLNITNESISHLNKTCENLNLFSSVAGEACNETNPVASILNDSFANLRMDIQSDSSNQSVKTLKLEEATPVIDAMKFSALNKQSTYKEEEKELEETNIFDTSKEITIDDDTTLGYSQHQLIKRRECYKLRNSINAKKYLQCSCLDAASVRNVMETAIEIALDYHLQNEKQFKLINSVKTKGKKNDIGENIVRKSLIFNNKINASELPSDLIKQKNAHALRLFPKKKEANESFVDKFSNVNKSCDAIDFIKEKQLFRESKILSEEKLIKTSINSFKNITIQKSSDNRESLLKDSIFFNNKATMTDLSDDDDHSGLRIKGKSKRNRGLRCLSCTRGETQ